MKPSKPRPVSDEPTAMELAMVTLGVLLVLALLAVFAWGMLRSKKSPEPPSIERNHVSMRNH